jgi:hypothetical protein
LVAHIIGLQDERDAWHDDDDSGDSGDSDDDNNVYQEE